jgi:Flp pilus assembly protein TadG
MVILEEDNVGKKSNKRSGAAVVYGIIIMTVLLGFCSLAVDYGRFVTCQTELHNTADAAALAAVQDLVNGTSAATNAATSYAADNTADGVPVNNSNDTITVTFLNWVSPTNYTVLPSAAGANAVRVMIQYTVPLLFGQIVGISGEVASETSTAAVATQSTTTYVSAYSNPWLAGEPTGTQASQPDPAWAGQGVNPEHPWEYDIAGPVGGTAADGEPYESPNQININLIPGAAITL